MGDESNTQLALRNINEYIVYRVILFLSHWIWGTNQIHSLHLIRPPYPVAQKQDNSIHNALIYVPQGKLCI
jgi:hypothetical protein